MFSPDSFEKGHFTAPEITRGEVYLSHTIRKHIKLKAKKIPGMQEVSDGQFLAFTAKR